MAWNSDMLRFKGFIESVSDSSFQRPSEAVFRAHPLMHYATISWVAHAKKSEQKGTPQDDLLSYFSWPSPDLFRKWVTLHRALKRDFQSLSLTASVSMTLLHLSARYLLFGPMQALLAKGANVNVLDKDGATPLIHTVRFGLDDNTPRTDEFGTSDDTEDDLLRSMQLLLDAGAKIDAAGSNGQTPLHYAAMRGSEAMIRLLIDGGALVNAKNVYGSTALHNAAMFGQQKVARLLVDKLACIDSADYLGLTALHWAVMNRDGAMVKLLIEAGAEVNAIAWTSGWAPLHLAVEKQREDMIQLLLDGGARVDLPNANGRTPLELAAMHQREPIMRLLKGRGAEL